MVEVIGGFILTDIGVLGQREIRAMIDLKIWGSNPIGRVTPFRPETVMGSSPSSPTKIWSCSLIGKDNRFKPCTMGVQISPRLPEYMTRVVQLVDALGESVGLLICVGSNPTPRTKIYRRVDEETI